MVTWKTGERKLNPSQGVLSHLKAKKMASSSGRNTFHVPQINFGRSIYHRVPVIARSGFGRKRLLLLLRRFRPLSLCFSRCRAASALELGHPIYTGLPIMILSAKKKDKNASTLSLPCPPPLLPQVATMPPPVAPPHAPPFLLLYSLLPLSIPALSLPLDGRRPTAPAAPHRLGRVPPLPAGVAGAHPPGAPSVGETLGTMPDGPNPKLRRALSPLLPPLP